MFIPPSLLLCDINDNNYKMSNAQLSLNAPVAVMALKPRRKAAHLGPRLRTFPFLTFFHPGEIAALGVGERRGGRSGHAWNIIQAPPAHVSRATCLRPRLFLKDGRLPELFLSGIIKKCTLIMELSSTTYFFLLITRKEQKKRSTGFQPLVSRPPLHLLYSYWIASRRASTSTFTA